MTLAPSKIEVDLDPGLSKTVRVKLRNDFKVPISVKRIEAWDFAVDVRGDPVPLLPRDALNLRGAGAWLKLPKNGFVVPPGHTVEFPITVAVPAKAADGTHYAYVRVAALLERSGKAAARVNFKLNGLLLVNVSGIKLSPAQVFRTLKIVELQAPVIAWTAPVNFGVLLENKGNVHQTARGTVTVLNGGGGSAAKIFVGKRTLLPESRSLMEGSWKTPPLFGRFTARARIDAGLGRNLSAERTVWVVSPMSVVLAGALLAVLSGAAMFIRKNYALVKRS